MDRGFCSAIFVWKKLQPQNSPLYLCSASGLWLHLSSVRLPASYSRTSSVQFLVHVHGEEDSIFETDMAAADGGNDLLLVQILGHFPSAQCIEVLLSICRSAVARAADTTGLHLHKVRHNTMKD